MDNGVNAHEFDDWLLRLENLQRALRSCSSSQPRRLKSPLVTGPDSTSLPRYYRGANGVSLGQTELTQSPSSVPPSRRYPQPPTRKIFNNVQSAPQRKFVPPSPVHHYFPGQPFPEPACNGGGEILGEGNGHEQQSRVQQQIKLKTVRWSAETVPQRPCGMQRLVSDLDIVEADLAKATADYPDDCDQMHSGALYVPEIPPPPAFTNGGDYDKEYHSQEPAEPMASPVMSFSPIQHYRDGTSSAERSSLQSQENDGTLKTGRSSNPSDWMGNLHFWKSLQNGGEMDLMDSHGQWDEENEKKVVLRVHQPDRTTKAVYVNSRTDAGEVVLMLAAKNFLPLTTKMALVEKVPSMKLERCFEDDEVVRDCILSWPVNNENLIFFEEREDLFGIFEDPGTWLGSTLTGDTARMKKSLLSDILDKDGPNRLPPFKDHLYILQPSNKWKRRYCVLRSSGLYASKKRGSGTSELVRVTAFGEHLHLYTTSGGWRKDNTPTPYGFVLKPHSVVTMDPHMVRAFCAATEETLRIWCSLIRILLMGSRMQQNYLQRLAACALNRQPSRDCEGLSTLVSVGGDGVGGEASLAEAVRLRYARESTAMSGAGLRESARHFARLPAIARARSVSQIQAQLAQRQGWALSTSQMSLAPAASTSDLGCVSGRTDVGRTSSMNELCGRFQAVANSGSTHSLNTSQRLSSLFYPLRWSRRNVNESLATPQPMRKSIGAPRRGPAARKCHRSTGNLNRPPSLSPVSSVFFLSPNSGEQSTRASAAIEEPLDGDQGQRNSLHLSQQQPLARRPVAASPSMGRTSGPFAGVRSQLLPSQISPLALFW